MKKIFLIVYFGAKNEAEYLKFHPFKWFFLWRSNRDYKVTVSGYRSFDVWSPRDKTERLDEMCETMNLTLRRRIAKKINFLCFSCSFRQWITDDDVKSIYGKKYDYKTETLEGARSKMSALANTGYFA